MTVVAYEQLVTLVCDTCSDTADVACALPDAQVVWPLVSEQGWSGSPFAAGPHRCPHCSALGPSTGGAGVCEGHGPSGILGIDHVDGVTVVVAAGDVDLDTGDTLRSALAHAREMGGHVLVDLTRVHLIDSTGLGLLVRAHRDAVERGAVLCLAAPAEFVRTVLYTMRLDQVFPIFDSHAEALAHLSSLAPGRAS